jgi:hypothetical protein
MKYRGFILVLLFCILFLYAATAVPVTNGSLYVGSYPTGATILIDGAAKGTTNGFVSDVTPGLRNLTLTKTGYQDATVWVDVPSGGLKVVAPITLSRGSGPAGMNGTMYVGSYPTMAGIFIDNEYRGLTNGFVYDVPAGLRNLTLLKGGYQAAVVQVNVVAGETKVLAPIQLIPL